MDKEYKGIKLTGLDKNVQFSHSKSAFMLSNGQVEREENVDYFNLLLERQVSSLTQSQFDQISALNSVSNMNYQICNGGIDQYFFNNYDKSVPPIDEEDIAHVDKDKQCLMLDTLIDFGLEVFPEREEENKLLEKVVRQFKEIYVENTEQFETIYSDEDEEIWSEEADDWVINPNYEEPYETFVGYEDELFNADNFDENYYKVNDYLELLIETYAQYLTKSYDEEQSLENKISNAKNKAENMPKDENSMELQEEIHK